MVKKISVILVFAEFNRAIELIYLCLITLAAKVSLFPTVVNQRGRIHGATKYSYCPVSSFMFICLFNFFLMND